MNLSFMTQFSNRLPTNFVGKIKMALMSGISTDGTTGKFHTLRESDKIKVGQKLHLCTGTRTKYYDCFAMSECYAKQVVKITCKQTSSLTFSLYINIDDYELNIHQIKKFTENDGFDLLWNFRYFFFPTLINVGDSETITRNLIHFTPRKYVNGELILIDEVTTQ